MARHVKVIQTCDRHSESEDIEATQTVTLLVNGREVELDLCDDHGKEFYEVIDPWVQAGRPVSGTPSRGGARRTRRSQGAGRPDTKAIRAWAERNGIEMAGRGRIPQTIVDQYNAAL